MNRPNRPQPGFNVIYRGHSIEAHGGIFLVDHGYIVFATFPDACRYIENIA